jgi:RNase P protein component
MRAAWDHLLPMVADGFDVVIVARARVLGASSREAAGEMESALRSLGAIVP